MSLLDLETPKCSWNSILGLGSTFCLATLKVGDNSKDLSVILEVLSDRNDSMILRKEQKFSNKEVLHPHRHRHLQTQWLEVSGG